MDDEKKDRKGPKVFCVKDVPVSDFPPWYKKLVAGKIIWDANESRDINNGPRGLHHSESGDLQGAHYTGHHFEKVYDYHDPIQMSAAYVDLVAETDPRQAGILHGRHAEPPLAQLLSVGFNTKVVYSKNPLHVGDRDISVPQRKKADKGICRIFDIYFYTGIYPTGKK